MGREVGQLLHVLFLRLGVLWGTCRGSRAVAGLGWVLLEGRQRHHNVE